MKNALRIFVVLLFYQNIFGQEKNNFSNHEIGVDFGSYRDRYLYPITNINYRTPKLGKTNFLFSMRLRSYGTLYFYSKNSYDLNPIASYYFTTRTNLLNFSIGLGCEARIRLNHDIRSEAKSSAEPLIELAAYRNLKKFSFSLPLWTKLYNNGISITILPKASLLINSRISVFLYYELNYLKIYKIQAHEWTRDCFLGARILL